MENYYSVLHFGVELERDEAVRLLLKNGFNPNVKTISGETALHIASGFPRIVFYNSYRNKLYAFNKWSLSLEEAQKICNYHGGHFDVSLLKYPQYYKIQKSNWIICLGNNGDMNVLSIYDDVAASEVTENYQTLE